MFSRGGAYDSDAIAYFNELDPSSDSRFGAYKSIINNFILRCKSRENRDFTGTNWDELDLAVNCRTIEEQHALVSIKNPTLPQATNNAYWTPLNNIGCDNTGTEYINTNFNPSTHAVKYIQTSASIGIWLTDEVQTNTTVQVQMGYQSADGLKVSYIIADYLGDQYAKIVSDGNFDSAATPDSSGLKVSNRVGNTTEVWSQGSMLSSDVATPPGAIQNENIFVFAFNEIGAGPILFSKKNGCAFYFVASGNLDQVTFEADVSELLDDLAAIQKRYYAFGNSITEGSDGVTNYISPNWVNRVAVAKGWTPINYGVTGTVLIDAAPTDPAGTGPNMYSNMSAIPVYNSSTDVALSFKFTMNDWGFNYVTYTTSLWKSQFIDVIDYAHNTKGWPYSKIFMVVGAHINDVTTAADSYLFFGVPVAADITRYEDMRDKGQEIKTATGIFDCIDIWYTGSTGSNAIHPDATGYGLIADVITTALDGFSE